MASVTFCVCFWRDSPQWDRGSSFSITHNDATQSLELLWTSDQLPAETSTSKHTQNSQQTNIHVSGGIETHNLSKQAAADLRLRPRSHWDRLCYVESTKSHDYKRDISVTRFVASYFETCFQILKPCLSLYLRSFVLVLQFLFSMLP